VSVIASATAEAGSYLGIRSEKTLAQSATHPANGPDMLQPETLSQFENIKKRAGYLWRFL
jgi:hypothetical protein